MGKDCDEKITIKDVYVKILALEIEMDTTKKDIHLDLVNLRSYFSIWLWIMTVLNLIQIILFYISTRQ